MSTAMKRELVEGTDWMVTATGMFRCPCGNLVEDDGECPSGHVSPLRRMGMI